LHLTAICVQEVGVWDVPLDGRDKRRALEQCSCEGLQGTGHLRQTTLGGAVQTCHAHVLLTRTLLSLHQTRCTVDADDQVTRHL